MRKRTHDESPVLHRPPAAFTTSLSASPSILIVHHYRSSATSRLVARCTLLAACDPLLRTLVPAETEAALAAMLELDEGNAWFEFALRHAWSRASLRCLQHAILPGITVHFLARKLWIERSVTAALKDGCNQLVVVGAGLDTLALRLHRSWPGVTFWELDHPASQRPKAAALRTLAPGGNLFQVPLDLRNELPSDVLQRNPDFNPGRRTCFLAEGLLMYMPGNLVLRVLQDMARHPASEIVLTFMEPGPDGRAAFRGGSPAIARWLRWRNEPFDWAISRTSLAGFMSPLCLRVRSVVGPDELRASFLVPAGLASSPLAEGECMARLFAAT